MKQNIKRACSFLSRLSFETHVWSIGVILAAILLCVSFFNEPMKIDKLATKESENPSQERIIEYSSVLGQLFMPDSRYDEYDEDEIVVVVEDDIDIDINDVDKLSEIEELIPKEKDVQTVGFESVEEAIEIAGVVPEDSAQQVISVEGVKEAKEGLESAEASDEQVDSTTVNVSSEESVDVSAKYTIEEIELLNRVVECEARSEDIRGKELVASVILNRVESGIWGDSIEEVLLSAGQFRPVTTGAIYVVTPSDETKQAVLHVLNGENSSKGALYFQKSKATVWGNKEYLFRHGAHSFYR